MAELTDPQVNKKEKIVKSMKKNIGDFKSRYGKDAKSVMYATATKLAKEDRLQWVASFPCSEDSYMFSRKLDQYTVIENQSLSREYDGTSSIFFESSIDNEHFLEWLAEESNAIALTLSYDNLLPGVPADPESGELYQTFEGFNRSALGNGYVKLSEKVDEAYKKTRAYKGLTSKNKQAIDYFMSEVEKQGMGKMDLVIKDTSKKYPIKSSDLSDFLEHIFFAEDIQYMRSLAEADDNKEVQKSRENKSEKDTQDAKDKKEKKQQKKEQDGKDVTKAKKDAAQDRESKTDDGKEGQQGGAGGKEQTFKNFHSDLKNQNSKGTESIGGSTEADEPIALEKPISGSPINPNPKIDEDGIDLKESNKRFSFFTDRKYVKKK